MINGLYYFSNIGNFTNVITQLDELEWKPITNSINSRKVQQYGYQYLYDAKNAKTKIQPIPDFLLDLKNILLQKCQELKLDINDLFISKL